MVWPTSRPPTRELFSLPQNLTFTFNLSYNSYHICCIEQSNDQKFHPQDENFSVSLKTSLSLLFFRINQTNIPAPSGLSLFNNQNYCFWLSITNTPSPLRTRASLSPWKTSSLTFYENFPAQRSNYSEMLFSLRPNLLELLWHVIFVQMKLLNLRNALMCNFSKLWRDDCKAFLGIRIKSIEYNMSVFQIILCLIYIVYVENSRNTKRTN